VHHGIAHRRRQPRDLLAAEAEPGGQLVQVAEPAAPSVVEYAPAGQDAQALAPVPLWKLPALQLMHEVAPASDR
jgi:hypothetical protein